jgi:hypothetical protein
MPTMTDQVEENIVLSVFEVTLDHRNREKERSGILTEASNDLF